jgi:hypothetical protein
MKGVLVLKTLRQIHFLKKIFRSLKSSNEKQDEDSLDTISDYDDLSELDSNDFSTFEDDEDTVDQEEDSNSEDLHHFTSVGTDYESCFDEEDDEFEVQCSNIPRIQRRKFISRLYHSYDKN